MRKIGVYWSDGTKCPASRYDSPTRFAGGLPAGRSQRGSARHRRPFTTALPLRYPSEREPFAQTRGNSLPDKRFLPAPQGSLPEGAPPAGGGGVYRQGHFYPFKQFDKPKFEILLKYYTTLPQRNQVSTGEFNHRFAHSFIEPKKRERSCIFGGFVV